MNKTKLFLELTELVTKQEDWINSLPDGLYSCFVENEYNRHQDKIITMLMESIYTPSELDDVYWWWYEFKFVQESDGPHVDIPHKGVSYTFENIDQFLEYLVKEEGWEPL